MNTLSSLLKNLRNRTPVGTVEMFAGSSAPTDWLLCNGAAVSRTTYASLFSVIGTTFGAGNGSTTFNLPDFRGRMPLGVGNGTATGHVNHPLADAGGNENLITPYHRHSVAKVEDAITGGSHTHSVTALHYDSSLPTTNSNTTANGRIKQESLTTGAKTHTHDLPAHYTAYAGSSGNATGANMPPYMTVNFIIYAGK